MLLPLLMNLGMLGRPKGSFGVSRSSKVKRIRLAEVLDRESTAEFIKAHLKARQAENNETKPRIKVITQKNQPSQIDDETLMFILLLATEE